MEQSETYSLPNGEREIGKVSLQTFMEKYYRREDGFKYEFHDGKVIKSDKTMNDKHQHIANNLIDFFYELKFQGKVEGRLVAEKDNWFTRTRYRTPDLCYMSPQDMYDSSHGGQSITQFAIEIVSPRDTADQYEEKLDLYFQAGMKVVWLIYPKSEKVKIYQPDQSSITCQGDAICSGAPVLPEFALPAKDIFRKPSKPGAPN